MTAYMAAKPYGIPKMTILDKVCGGVPVVCRSGPDHLLSSDEEKRLVKWALNMFGGLSSH